MTFFAYARVSTDDQAQSIQAQHALLDRYADALPRNPRPLVRLITDEGVSGSTPMAERAGGALMLSQLRRGDEVGVVALDRGWRSVLDCLGTITAWDRQGVTLHILNFQGSSLDLGTAMGRFFLTTVAAFAELERGMISERTRRGLAERKRQGVLLGSPPYGYLRVGPTGWAPDPEEFPRLAWIYENVDKITPRAMADLMNSRGWRNRKGNTWTSSSVAKLVSALRTGNHPMVTGLGVLA